MKGVNENRYLLHAVLREIQELSPVTSAESVTSTTSIRNLIRTMSGYGMTGGQLDDDSSLAKPH